jgi:hypothetical protein
LDLPIVASVLVWSRAGIHGTTIGVVAGGAGAFARLLAVGAWRLGLRRYTGATS